MTTGCEDPRDYEELSAQEERRAAKVCAEERFREMDDGQAGGDV